MAEAHLSGKVPDIDAELVSGVGVQPGSGS